MTLTLPLFLLLAAAACFVVAVLAFAGVLDWNGHAWLAGGATAAVFSLILGAPRTPPRP